MFFNKNKDELIFYRQYTYHGSYSTYEKFKRENIKKILLRYKNAIDIDGSVSIESKFNNRYYPVFDLDKNETIQKFKDIYSDTPYVLFRSSRNLSDYDESHYWAILDTPRNKFNDIYFDYNWKVINDNKYCKFSKSYNRLFIRGLYDDKSRKPIISEINGTLSKDMSKFISLLEDYYNNEALELSIMRYKDHDMLLQYNRKMKMKNINNNE